MYMTNDTSTDHLPSSEDVKLEFSQKNKHNMIELKDRNKVGVSNITALKPQYALLAPHLNTAPSLVK